MSDLDAKRDEFRSRVRVWEASFDEDDESADASNRALADLDSWVETLGSDAKGTLEPLLSDDSPLIRGTAASYLLDRGAADRATEVLNEVADNDDYGYASTMASARLRMWRKSQG